MDLDTSLSYFYAVVRAGSIRQAAEKLHVSASAVSRMIQKVEDRFKTPLFERRAHGMVLTPSGDVLFKHLAGVMRHISDAEARIAELNGLVRGEISVYGADAALPDVISRFRRAHPNILVTARMCSTDQVIRSLLSYEADIGIAYNMSNHPGIEVLHRFPFPVCALMAPRHPLAAAKAISLKQASAFPIAMADGEFGVRRTIDEAFDKAGVRLAPMVTTNSLDLLRRLAAVGDVITFGSSFTARSEIAAGMIKAVPISETENLVGTIMICKRRDRALLLAVGEFIASIADIYSPNSASMYAVDLRDCGSNSASC